MFVINIKIYCNNMRFHFSNVGKAYCNMIWYWTNMKKHIIRMIIFTIYRCIFLLPWWQLNTFVEYKCTPYTFQNKTKKMYALLYFDRLHKIHLKYIWLCDCKMTKCEKFKKSFSKAHYLNENHGSGKETITNTPNKFRKNKTMSCFSHRPKRNLKMSRNAVPFIVKCNLKVINNYLYKPLIH